jgi:uncharacterized protein YdeI (YjbR/CyaY-like superfamily)
MKRNKTVEEFFKNEERWTEELKTLREIIGETELVETVKWGTPVYTINGKNVVGIGSFKSYFGLWFFQGVFLKDKAGKLINAQEDITKGLRQWHFGSADEIEKELILQYLGEAIENQKTGMEIKPVKKNPPVIPPELTNKFKENRSIKKSFEKFSPSKQREFAEYISEAKREDTKQKRLEKIIPLILENVGLNDKYKR